MNFGFIRIFVLELGASTGQMDRQTDEQVKRRFIYCTQSKKPLVRAIHVVQIAYCPHKLSVRLSVTSTYHGEIVELPGNYLHEINSKP